jgi:hypothetical protein
LDPAPGAPKGDGKKEGKKAKKAKKVKKTKDDKAKKDEPAPEQGQPQPPQYPPTTYPQQWPYPYPPPRIIVSPQIQVQVNPRMDIKAEPKANADADANANAKAEANPEATADAKIDTTIESKQVLDAQGSGSGASQDGSRPVEQTVVQLPPPEPKDFSPLAGYREPRKGAFITGLVLFGISYGSSAFAGYKLREGCGKSNKFSGCNQTANNMFIPVAGPALNVQRSNVQTTQFAMAFAAGAQATGALLTVIGAVIIRRDRQRNRILEEAAGMRLSKNVRVGTTAGPTGGRLQLSARF